jgi:hypothetical protein
MTLRLWLMSLLVALDGCAAPWVHCEHAQDSIEEEQACKRHLQKSSLWSKRDAAETVATVERQCLRFHDQNMCVELGHLCAYGSGAVDVAAACSGACDSTTGPSPYCCTPGVDRKERCAEYYAEYQRKENEEVMRRVERQRAEKMASDLAEDPSTPINVLFKLVKRRDPPAAAVNRLLRLAKDPTTSPDWLEELGQLQDAEFDRQLASNPALPLRTVVALWRRDRSGVRDALARNQAAAGAYKAADDCFREKCGSPGFLPDSLSGTAKGIPDGSAHLLCLKITGGDTNYCREPPRGPSRAEMWKSLQACEESAEPECTRRAAAAYSGRR